MYVKAEHLIQKRVLERVRLRDSLVSAVRMWSKKSQCLKMVRKRGDRSGSGRRASVTTASIGP